MRTKLYLGITLLLLFLSMCRKTNAQSPGWLWAKSIGGESSDAARSIAVDPESGDVYTSGVFSGTVDFDPGIGTFNLTSIGSSDIFITKLDSAGNFVWAKAIGGPDVAYVVSISFDPAGNVYITGSFQGTVDFDPGERTFNLSSKGNSDIFITKLDGSGNFEWVKGIGGPNAVYVLSMSPDPSGSGDIYTTGYFYGTIDFDPGPGKFNLTSKGDADVFISKLDGSGNFVWAIEFGGPASDVSRSIAIDPTGSGDVYTTGWFSGTADFDPGQNLYNITSVGRFDIFISKIDASGNFVWGKQLGGTGAKDGSGSSIAIDPGNGDIYTTGYFEGTADFDPDKGIFNLVSSGLRDIFISKLNSNGDFIWARAMGGTGLDVGSSIIVDPSETGGVYIAGNFHPYADFDPGSDAFNLPSAGSFDIFISKLDGFGNFVWAKSIGGKKGEVAGSLALDALGHVYVTGFFNCPAIWFGSTTLHNEGDGDIFVAKLNVNKIVSVINIRPQQVSIYPIPTKDKLNVKFNEEESGDIKISLYDMNGDVVFVNEDDNNSSELSFDISWLPAAIYFVELNVNGNKIVKQVVKTQE